MSADYGYPAFTRERKLLSCPMLTRQQVHDYLFALGFVASADESPLTCGGIQVSLLDAPRIAATSPKGDRVYLAVYSAHQLEEQLTHLLGYQRPK